MPTSPTAPLQRITVFVDRELGDRIREMAREQDRSQTSVIRNIIRQALAERDCQGCQQPLPTGHRGDGFCEACHEAAANAF